MVFIGAIGLKTRDPSEMTLRVGDKPVVGVEHGKGITESELKDAMKFLDQKAPKALLDEAWMAGKSLSENESFWTEAIDLFSVKKKFAEICPGKPLTLRSLSRDVQLKLLSDPDVKQDLTRLIDKQYGENVALKVFLSSGLIAFALLVAIAIYLRHEEMQKPYDPDVVPQRRRR